MAAKVRMKKMKFIIASNNPGKIRDFNNILTILGHEAVSLKEAGIVCDPEENGTTFAENAYAKAKAIFDICRQPVIADDSGLSVYALDGEPGVFSARYGGDGLDDKERCFLLMKNTEHLKEEEKDASFHCALCCILSDGEVLTAEGEIKGKIINELRGENGFGYDPMFYSYELEKTFGEAVDEEKNGISHRARALKILAEKLKAKFN